MSWENQIQIASFKGVTFDVIATDDANTRAAVEHQYPYVDGSDLEDMGANAHEVTMQAVVFGDTYETKLRQLIDVLMEKGAGVLIHPIHGRMPDMLAMSWPHHHDAEMRNYVSLTIMFKKSTQGNPIFSSSSIFGAIDKILAKIDDILEQVQYVADMFYGAISTVSAFKSRFRAITSIASTIGAELNYRLNGVYSFSNNKSTDSGSGFGGFVDTLHSATKALFDTNDISGTVSNQQRFSNMLTTAQDIMSLPMSVATKTNAMASTALDLGVPTVASDALELQALVNTVVIGNATEFLADLIHDNNVPTTDLSDLSPPEIEMMVNTLRALAQETIDLIRDGSFVASTYDGFYSMIDSLRQIQHQLKTLAMQTIAKRPPLIARFAPFDGTLHQIAHAFYGDYSRFDELLALNPHLTHPSFITTGDLINGYTR